MRQRTGGLIFLMLSVAAGLLAALLAVSYLRGAAETADVLVATVEIAPFTPLSPTIFRVERWPARAVPSDALREPSAVAGRYARGLVLAGSVLRASHLADATGASGSLAARLTASGEPDARALAIPVDSGTGVGGTVQPGDRVDLIAAVRVERENGPPLTYAKIIARAVPVLYRTDEGEAAGSTVVVQVTPAVAEEVAFAQLAGRIHLAVTPYTIDKSAPPTQGVTPDLFLERHAGR